MQASAGITPRLHASEGGADVDVEAALAAAAWGPEMAYEGENYAPYGGPVGSAKELCLRSLKRTHTMYLSNYGQRPDFEEPCAAPPPFPPECLAQEGPISHGRWCFAG